MADVQSFQSPVGSDSQPKKAGCFKVAGFGCLLLVIIGLGMGYYLMRNVTNYRAVLASKGVEAVANQLFKRMALDDALREELRPILSDLAAEIASRNMSPEEAFKASTQLGGPKVIGPLAMQGLKSKYLSRSSLSESQKAQIWQDATRFGHGLGEGTISSDHLRKFMSLMHTFHPDPSVRAKGNAQDDFFAADYISDENILVLWHEIKASADAHSIEQKTFPLEIAKRLRDILDDVRAQHVPTPTDGENI